MAITALDYARSTLPTLPPPVVLAVEDEAMILLVSADYLREGGFEVIEARNAEEALAVLESDIHVDVLFSDVRMPGEMDGVGLARWARLHRPQIAILLTSGFLRETTQADDLCDDGPVLDKPYEAEEMERRIRDMLAARNVPPPPADTSHRPS